MPLSFVSSRRSLVCTAMMLPLAVTGCVSIGPDTPKADPGFVPKITYDMNYDTAWARVIAALGTNSIPIASSSRETGQIVTDYIGGSTNIGLANANSRYKYTIFLLRASPNRTTINITAVLESGSNGLGFHDVSAFNTERVTNLRNALYEKIERSL